MAPAIRLWAKIGDFLGSALQESGMVEGVFCAATRLIEIYPSFPQLNAASARARSRETSSRRRRPPTARQPAADSRRFKSDFATAKSGYSV